METKAEDCQTNLDGQECSSAVLEHSPAVFPLEGEVVHLDAALPYDQPASPPTAVEQSPSGRTESSVVNGGATIYRTRKISKPAYQTAAALLSILLIALAVYVIRGTGSVAALRNMLSTHLRSLPPTAAAPAPQPSPPNDAEAASSPGMAKPKKGEDQASVQILFKEAKALADRHRFEESKVFIRRILEINPSDEAAMAALKELEAGTSGMAGKDGTDELLDKKLARISALISSSKLQTAKVELDKLQKSYPQVYEVLALRKRLDARNSKATSEMARKDEEQKEAARKQKEEEWTRRLTDLFTHGKYSEARGVSNLWLAEDPTSARGQELRAKIEEIQRGLSAYESAMAENRFQDALNALGIAELVNPADSNLAVLRRRVEARKAAASATLTVRRLGDRASLLLDGKPLGKDGELENESVAIGSHTLAIENGEGFKISKSQEFFDGQKAVYVYDLARRQLRPMVETDRDLLTQRKAMEEVRSFAVEHSHGWLRGSCKGVLLVNYIDVEYKPASGSHGFRLPFKRLNLKAQGKSLDLSYASDDKDFQSFRVQDAQAAEKIGQMWDHLKTFGQ